MDKKQEIKDLYDGYAEYRYNDATNIKDIHTDISPVMRYYRSRKVETALGMGKFASGANLLEVGSNAGQYTTILVEKGFAMTGIDLSDKALVVARRNAELSNLKNVEYFTSDAEDMSLFKDNTFDGVVSFSTLRYVPDLKKALGEIYRVTKKGGTVALDFPNKHCPWFNILKNKFGVNNHIYDNFYSAGELRRLFAAVGFTVIETRNILYTHYKFSPRLLATFKAIDFVGERTPVLKELAAIIFCKGVKS